MTELDALELELKATTIDAPLPDITPRALAAGALDVAYATLDSPLGTLLVASTDRGLVRISYLEIDGLDPVLEELAIKISPRVLAAPRRLDETRRELEEYFSRARRGFDLPIDWSLAHGFGRRVLEATFRIPYGEVSTYKEIAVAAGSPRGHRAAGNALGANPIPIVVPCHRVLRTGGALGGYTGDVKRKRQLLRMEGNPNFGSEGNL